MPSGATMRLPLRKSPWTTTGAERARTVVPEPAEGQLEGGMRLTQPVDDGPELLEGIATGKAGNLGRRHPVDGGEDLATAGGQTGPDLGQFLVAQDAARDRLPFDELHDQRAGAEGGVVTADDDDAGHRDTHPAGGTEEGALEPQTRRGGSGRVAPQDEAPGAVGTDRREGPGLARGAARRPGEAVDHHRVTDHGLQGVGELVGEIAVGHGAEATPDPPGAGRAPR